MRAAATCGEPTLVHQDQGVNVTQTGLTTGPEPVAIMWNNCVQNSSTTNLQVTHNYPARVLNRFE